MKFLTEEFLIIVVVGIIAICGLFYLKSENIPLAVLSGLLGYLTKSAKDAITEKESE